MVQRLLKMEKVTDVTIAADGKIAYDVVLQNMAKTDNFDLIFMDVQVSSYFHCQRLLISKLQSQMPNMDGLEATKLIREAGYKGPIVALSAYSDEANVKVLHST